MRILFLAENYKQWVASTIYDEQKAIKKKLTDSVFYGPGFRYKNSCVNEIINEIFGLNKPDAIFCYINEKRLLGKPMSNEISSKYSVPNSLKVFPTGLHKVKVPKIAWINDFWHCTRQEWEKILIGNGFDIAFATYCPPFIKKDIFNRFFSEKVQESVIFIPWPRAVSTETYADNNLKKIYDITLLGSMNENFYPLRVKMNRSFSKQENIKYFHKCHPGYRFCGTNDLVGSKYAECINQSHLFASCTGIYNIPFIKLYEAMACASLLLCDSPHGAEYLGLKNEYNYVSVNENNFVDIALKYLKKPNECSKIASNGRKLICEKHNVEIRAKEFTKVIDSLLNENRARCWAKLSPNWTQSDKNVKFFSNIEKKRKSNSGKVMDKKRGQNMLYKENMDFRIKQHITDLVKRIDKHSYDIWYKFGANYCIDEMPPIVTEFPELVMLRGLYLKKIARKINAQFLVEVGTARGFQSFIWAKYLKENKYNKGKIITCDIVGEKERIFKTPITGQNYMSRNDLWKGTSEAKYVTFVHGDSLEMANLIEREIDLLYIDGEHSAEAVLCDFKNLSQFFHSKSVIVFDDCDERFPGVQDAVKKISTQLELNPQIVSFEPSKYKIAIINLENSPVRLIQADKRKKYIPQLNKKEKNELCQLYSNEYENWFKKICIQSVIDMYERDPIVWEGRPLAWDAGHEIMAYHIFSNRKIPINKLLFLSNNRYKLLEKLWPKGNLTKAQVEDFYMHSKEILPWGHGVFVADHNTQERRKKWVRRISILKMLQELNIDSICDYGAGGGHTSLLAKTMGFKRIIHHEYSAFHPYVKWRSDQIGNFGNAKQEFELSMAEVDLKLEKPVNAVLCMDVAEHVWDPKKMLEEINNSLETDGYLVWNSVFGEGISCHLHPELKGKEEKILGDYGFQRIKELNVNYSGHSGLYKKTKQLKIKDISHKSIKLKPKILFIVDAPNWAHDYKTQNLQSQLSDQYDIEKIFCDNIQVENIETADIVVIYYWGQLLNENMQKLKLVFNKKKPKILLGICSHNEMSGSNLSIGLKTLKEYASAIFMNNRLLFDEFSPYFDIPVFYTPNGVDTSYFKPIGEKKGAYLFD